MNDHGRSPDGGGALSDVYSVYPNGVSGDGWGSGYADGVAGFASGDGGVLDLKRQGQCYASFQYAQYAENVGR